MIKRETFSEEHIRSLHNQSKRDPILLERTVYAFGLLEALARVGMPFVFKGGTCLMLLLDKPQRLSTDIDIIVEPGTNLDEYLEKAAKVFPFHCVDEQVRVGKNDIIKRHFKFLYNSPVSQKEFYILLDVLFEHQQYASLVRREIRNELLLTEPEYLSVLIPDENSILAESSTFTTTVLSLTVTIVPWMPPIVTTLSPFFIAASIAFASLSLFFCGRIIIK